MIEIGWIGAILMGGLAGWLAGKFMDARHGIFMNILLGIIGSVVANAILRQFQIFVTGGWLAYLITGFIGACVLLFVVKLIRK
jgi:uncharacterized membrane protein YeaQ/YmgE (transglycosylase-associated protein family)